MAPEALEAVPQHRPAGQLLVLLRPLGTEALAASRRDDQGHAIGQGRAPFALGPGAWTLGARPGAAKGKRESLAGGATSAYLLPAFWAIESVG
jgi:hypothetical protein